MWEAEHSYIGMRLHCCDCGEERVCLVQCSSAQQQHLKRRQHADNSQVLDMVVGCTLPHL